MKIERKAFLAALLCCAGVLTHPAHDARAQADKNTKTRRAPILGADTVWADGPHKLIEGWRDKAEGDEMAAAFEASGIRSLRVNFAGLYSPRGPEATVRVKAENKMTNQFPWFPIDEYFNWLAARDFTTVVGINVEEGPDVASEIVQKIIDSKIESKLVAVELSNEPWLNHRPWLPEEYAARAGDVIERLTPFGVRFALPLTVGKDNNTPTKLSDNEWTTRMLRALDRRIRLRDRSDILGVLHLYARGVRGGTIKQFNELVRPFAPSMRYLVTEFNIRLGLQGNPHLTNKYAVEFALKLAEVMAQPEIEAMYVHAVPYHSVLYWSNGKPNNKNRATVIGQRDARLRPDQLTRGWHLTPAGRVYKLYSDLAWNGELIDFRGGDKQSYWTVKSPGGKLIMTMINDTGKEVRKRVAVSGRELTLSAPARSVTCFDQSGAEVAKLSLPY